MRAAALALLAVLLAGCGGGKAEPAAPHEPSQQIRLACDHIAGGITTLDQGRSPYVAGDQFKAAAAQLEQPSGELVEVVDIADLREAVSKVWSPAVPVNKVKTEAAVNVEALRAAAVDICLNRYHVLRGPLDGGT